MDPVVVRIPEPSMLAVVRKRAAGKAIFFMGFSGSKLCRGTEW
jgi:hypothetical protein